MSIKTIRGAHVGAMSDLPRRGTAFVNALTCWLYELRLEPPCGPAKDLLTARLFAGQGPGRFTREIDNVGD